MFRKLSPQVALPRKLFSNPRCQGLVTFSSVNAYQTLVTNQAVSTMRSCPRYDPNGYVAAVSSLNNRPGYQEYGVYISIGQGDNTVGSSRAQYAQAMINIATQITGLGRKCFLGVTVGMSGADSPTRVQRDNHMVNVVWAGRDDALLALASDPLVRAGANLRAVIGVPASTANDTALSRVNNIDYVHMTSATFDQAGVIVASALQAAGW